MKQSKFNDLYQSLTEMMPLPAGVNNAAAQNTTIQQAPSAAQQPQQGQVQPNNQPAQPNNQQVAANNAQVQQIVQAVLQQMQKINIR